MDTLELSLYMAQAMRRWSTNAARGRCPKPPPRKPLPPVPGLEKAGIYCLDGESFVMDTSLNIISLNHWPALARMEKRDRYSMSTAVPVPSEFQFML